MYASAAQSPRLQPVRLIHPAEAAQAVAALRTALRLGLRVLASVGFAGTMWLLLAGPGVLDGRSSTVDSPAQRSPAHYAGR